VEEPNTFGTDEYIAFCRKVGCEPYICTNAGTGSAEEMSDWVEYCNLKNEGQWARQRIANGPVEPHKVKYWSIGNENYGGWEIGAKSAEEWGRLVTESAKMMKRVDPAIELSAAALSSLDWNINLLRSCGERLDSGVWFHTPELAPAQITQRLQKIGIKPDGIINFLSNEPPFKLTQRLRYRGACSAEAHWISIHDYWDGIQQTNDYADYEQCIAHTNYLEDKVFKVRGLLNAMGLQNSIRIAFDEWNLRGWHHPNIHTIKQVLDPADYIDPRDKNDDNSVYTMADAVFTACFLNMANRNCDIVGMTNFAPVVNTRGCIYTYRDGIVLRSTYHVFDLYVNELGETVLDVFAEDVPRLQVHEKAGGISSTNVLDFAVTMDTGKNQNSIIIAVVNKDMVNPHTMEPDFQGVPVPSGYTIHTLAGSGTGSYNDVGYNDAVPEAPVSSAWNSGSSISLPPHSVNVIKFLIEMECFGI
jgi:alpha-N-arabinofuranosidase